MQNVKPRLQTAKYVNWDFTSKELMKLMHHACQNVHQANILTAPTSAKLALINASFVRQPLNALFAEKLSLFLMEIKSGTTTSTSSVKNNALIVTIKILKT